MEIEEKLIECVRERKVLYDVMDKKYVDSQFKGLIWNEVAATCGLPSGESAKDLWKKLRDGYRASLKRRKTSSGAGAKCSWKFDYQMSFLQHFMKDRPPRTGNIDLGSTSQATVELAADVEYALSPPSPLVTIEEYDCETPIQVKRTASERKESNVLLFLQAEAKKKEERCKEIDKLKRQLMQPDDSLKLFFDSMYLSTKTLPSHLQRKVKTALFKIVTDAEEEAANLQYYENTNIMSPSVSNYSGGSLVTPDVN